MNGLTAFLTAFCAGCVLIGALYLLCPGGAMQKPVRVIFSLVFLASLIAAALPIKPVVPELPAVSDSSVSADALTVAAAKYAYASALTRCGISFSEITVFTDKSDDGSINITKVVIYSPCDREQITEALGAAAQNYEVEIKNE